MGNCDIRVQNLTLAPGQTNPLPSGGSANFKFQIANYSNIDSDGFNVTVKRDGEIGGGGTFYVSKVPAMTVINYPLEISGVIGGTHEIEIEALYSDLDTSNNKVTGTFVWAGVPNLQTVITNGVPNTVELCQDTIINFRVNNLSYDHVSGTTNIKVLINDKPTNLGWTKEDFRARTYIEQSFTANFKETGVYKISIVADSLTVVESNEYDNIAEVTIKVNDATRLNNDDPTDPILINKGDVHWYYAQFEEDGKANFFVEPLNDSLDVDIQVYKDSVNGELIGQSTKGVGQWDLVEKKPVQAGIKYYIKIICYSGSGNYQLKCKNYSDNYSDLLKKTKSYVGNSGCSNLPVYVQESLTTYKGSISNGEEVTVLAIKNEVAYISYNITGGTKEGYVPLSHLDTEYWNLYIEKMKEKGYPTLKNGWYTYDEWIISQHFNDPTSSTNFKGHLGVDVVNINVPIARAVYPGKVIFAGRSKTNSGTNSANGYVVQIEHKYKNKDNKTITFYSFYAHLRPGSICVSNEQSVTAGDIVGLMGHTTSTDGGGMGDHIHVSVYSDGLRATGQHWGYFRNSSGRRVTFDESHGYKDGYIRFGNSFFYNIELWDGILDILQNDKK